MNENKAKVWLARDKNGELWLYTSIPYRDDCEWFCKEPCCKIDSSNFPSVSCEDSKATEAYITLAEPQEQPKPKQEIDWEQRRYEIAKDVITTYVSKIGFDEFDNNTPQQTETTMKIIELSIKIADALLGTLKQQSK